MKPPTENQLRRMILEDRMTHRQIAAAFGIGRGSISYWTQRFKVRTPLRYNIQEWIRLYVKEKNTICEIAERFGFPLSTVRFALKKHNVLRSIKEAIKLAIPKMKAAHIGRICPPRTEEWCRNISKGLTGRGKGFRLSSNGYFVSTRRATQDKLMHRVIMEKHLGRKLSRNEVVHHVDENRTNNNLKNLRVMTRSQHTKHHQKKRYAST